MSFLTNSEVRNPFQGLFFQILAIFTLKSKMAAGGHFGFWPLLGFAHTFERGIGAQFFLNTSKHPNPLANLPLLSVVTGGPNMTLLFSLEANVLKKVPHLLYYICGILSISKIKHQNHSSFCKQSVQIAYSLLRKRFCNPSLNLNRKPALLKLMLWITFNKCCMVHHRLLGLGGELCCYIQI